VFESRCWTGHVFESRYSTFVILHDRVLGVCGKGVSACICRYCMCVNHVIDHVIGYLIDHVIGYVIDHVTDHVTGYALAVFGEGV
jgi:hypothetical protein